jgi:hypothetical protein
VLNVAEKKRHVPSKNILVQASKILPTIMPFYWVKTSVGAVLQKFSAKERNGRMRHESLKWLKGAKLEDLEDALVIWIGQVDTNNETATDGVVKEQAKILRKQMSVTMSQILYTKTSKYFAPKTDRITKDDKKEEYYEGFNTKEATETVEKRSLVMFLQS